MRPHLVGLAVRPGQAGLCPWGLTGGQSVAAIAGQQAPTAQKSQGREKRKVYQVVKAGLARFTMCLDGARGRYGNPLDGTCYAHK